MGRAVGTQSIFDAKRMRLMSHAHAHTQQMNDWTQPQKGRSTIIIHLKQSFSRPPYQDKHLYAWIQTRTHTQMSV